MSKPISELLMESYEEEKRQTELKIKEDEALLDKAYERLFAAGAGILFNKETYKNPQTLRQRFFYMYVERGNGHHKVSEKIFDGKDPKDPNYGYSLGMVNAFILMLEAIKAQKESGISAKFDFEFVNALHDAASNFREKNSIRSAAQGVQDAYGADEASMPYLQQVARDGYEIILHSLDKAGVKNSAGFIFNAHSSVDISFNRVRRFAKDDKTMPEMIGELIKAYEKANLEAGEDEQKKLLAIAAIIHDLNLLHPYKDCNARTFDAVLLNFLLLKEGLNPAMIYSNPCLESFTPDEAVIAIYEGQQAFRDFFVANLDIGDSIAPLTEELTAIFVETSRHLDGDGILKGDALNASFGLFLCKRQLEELKLKQKKGEEVLPQDFAALEANFLKSQSEAQSLSEKKYLPAFLQYDAKAFLEIFPEFKWENLSKDGADQSELQKFAKRCQTKELSKEFSSWSYLKNDISLQVLTNTLSNDEQDPQFSIIKTILQAFQKILLVDDLEEYAKKLSREIAAESQKHKELLAQKEERKFEGGAANQQENLAAENPDSGSVAVKQSKSLTEGKKVVARS